MIFDTHCHLNSEDLYPIIDEVIKSAEKVGVKKFLVVGYDKKTSLLAIKIAKQYECCYAAIGFHPTEVFDLSDADFNEIFNLATSDNKVVAIGEIGLDYYWIKDVDKRNIQKTYFIKQIEIANELKLPVAIHNRDSTDDCLKILKDHTPKYGLIMHCFSGSVEIMNEILKIDNAYVSLGGPVTFKNSITPKEIARKIPLDRLLVETDSPYLAPHPYRGKINEPKYIPFIINEISILRNIGIEEIERNTFNNSCRIFGIKNEI